MIDSTVSDFHMLLDNAFNSLVSRHILITFPLDSSNYRGYCLKTKGDTHETSIFELTNVSFTHPHGYDLSLKLVDCRVPLCLTIQKVKACKSMYILSLEMSMGMYQNKVHSHAYVVLVGRETVNGHETLLDDKVIYRIPVGIKFP